MNTIFALAFAGLLFGASTSSAQEVPAPPPQSPRIVVDQQRQEQQQIKEELDKAGQPKEQQTGLVTEKELLRILKSREAPEAVIGTVTQRGVGFDLTPEIEAKLRKAKATDLIIRAVLNAGPTARTIQMISPGLWSTPDLTVSPEEGKAFIALWNEQDPEKTISVSKDFVQKWPNSSLVTFAFAIQASAHSEKGDIEKAVEVAKMGLELRPDNMMALSVLTRILPYPRYLVAHEMERDKKLAEAENYATRALEEINRQTNKGAGGPEKQMDSRISGYMSDFHAALGMVYLSRATTSLTGLDKEELAKAERELSLAITATVNPSPIHYFRLGETYEFGGKIDDAITAFTKASELGLGTRVKPMADERIEELKKQQAAQPSKP